MANTNRVALQYRHGDAFVRSILTEATVEDARATWIEGRRRVLISGPNVAPDQAGRPVAEHADYIEVILWNSSCVHLIA